MKNKNSLLKFGRTIISAFCIGAAFSPHLVPACAGSRGLVCVLNPGACTKSMVMAKAVPAVVVLPSSGPTIFSVPITLFVMCPTNNSCGNFCTNSSLPVAASLTVNLYPAPCGSGSASATTSGTISTAGGTMVLPICARATAPSLGAGLNSYAVPVTIPAGTPAGAYCVVGTASVTFPGGMVLTQTGETLVCLAESAPGRPGVPRLNVELLSPSFTYKAPGDQIVATYRVTNNDPSNSVALTAIATSKQSAVRPQGANEIQGVFAISNPFGDDFPIVFNPATNCIPLPVHPYTQREITNALPVIGPGQTNIFTLAIRSYGQCASGSCSESTVRVHGNFADGQPAIGCAGMSLWVDGGVPSGSCARTVNDCNQNGIPDADDIAERRSADQNFNALPDECEQFISVPFFSSIAPTNPAPGAPIYVRVAFNEVVPMANVWANGFSLIRTQYFGAPLWQGTIPADTRPGPQTAYFLGKDNQGVSATFIATYTVRPSVQITRIILDGDHNAILEHNGVSAGVSVFVQENTNLNCQACWTNRPSGPHPSPYNTGAANSTRFFRLRN